MISIEIELTPELENLIESIQSLYPRETRISILEYIIINAVYELYNIYPRSHILGDLTKIKVTNEPYTI